MSEKQPQEVPDPSEQDTTDAPTGAVVITALLAAVILVTWFGIYVLNIIRG